MLRLFLRVYETSKSSRNQHRDNYAHEEVGSSHVHYTLLVLQKMTIFFRVSELGKGWYFLMLRLDELPLSDGWILLLSGISNNKSAKGFKFEAVKFVVLSEMTHTSSYLVGHPSNRTLYTFVCSYFPTMYPTLQSPWLSLASKKSC